jgi:DedD protein
VRACNAPCARLILVTSIPIVDIQAKDRLTGAVILVALVVLLVPELLSGPGSRRTPAATAASEGPPLRSYTVELGDEAHVHRVAGAAAATAAAPAVIGALPAAAEPVPPPPVPTPSHEPAAPPQAAQPAPPEPAESAAVASRPKSAAAAPAPAPGGGWMIQLGSFASRVNAERLVRELKTKGYPAFLTESANGGRELYRVRVGPASDHATAQALAAKLRAAGHPGSLTAHP